MQRKEKIKTGVTQRHSEAKSYRQPGNSCICSGVDIRIFSIFPFSLWDNYYYIFFLQKFLLEVGLYIFLVWAG